MLQNVKYMIRRFGSNLKNILKYHTFIYFLDFILWIMYNSKVEKERLNMSMKKLKDSTLGKVSGGRYYFRKYGDAYGMYCEKLSDIVNPDTGDIFDKLIDDIDATNIKDECIANPDINLIPENDPIPLIYLSEKGLEKVLYKMKKLNVGYIDPSYVR